MKRRAFLTLFFCFSSFCSFAQSDLQPAAIVNLIRSEPITVKQFRTEVENMEKSAGRTLTQAERLQVLDTLINERLVIQAAERDRVTVTENEVNQQVQQLRTGMSQSLGRPPTDAEFTLAIKNETNLEMPAFREQLRRQLITQRYLLSKKGTLINSVRAPTDDEIASTFNLTRTQFVRPETVRFSMIQIPYGADAAARTKARALADSLVREIGSNPSKFDEVVARSLTPNSGYQAGDGGFLPRNLDAQKVVGQEFMTVAFSLNQGEVSRLIEGLQGYQIIKITENYAQRNLELNDIFQLGTRVTVRDYVGNVLLQKQQQEVLAQASRELVQELRAGRTFQIFENNLTW